MTVKRRRGGASAPIEYKKVPVGDDARIERRILIGMIVSDKVIREVRSFYRPDLMRTPWGKIVAGWCLEYWQKFEKAPRKDIQHIFTDQVKDDKLDETNEKLIGGFLESLSEEYEQKEENFGADYILDQAERLFKSRNLSLVMDKVRGFVSQGDPFEAEKLLESYKRVGRETGSGVDPITDVEVIRSSFEGTDEEALFRFPGDLGDLIGPFTADGLGAFMGPAKRGKSFWLLEVVMRGVKAGLPVAYFGVGDMSISQMVRRIHVWNTGRHWNKKYCGDLLIPVPDCVYNQTGECSWKYRTNKTDGVIRDTEKMERVPFDQAPRKYLPCYECRKNGHKQNWKGAVWYRKRESVDPLTWREAFKSGQKMLNGGSGKLKMMSYPTKTASVRTLESQMDVWEGRDDFSPRLVVVDYADILAPIDGRKEVRHQHDETWSALRALSQKRHCCVITATQSDAASIDAHTVREKNFTEDRRKYDHVNLGIYTLNQIPEEKKAKVLRMGIMFVREDDFDVRNHVVVLECREVGRPFLGSFFP